jgi:2-oxoacid:acceptor oxidoreductase gamma subunit (pyruvate/2-ketoisovalerate family)
VIYDMRFHGRGGQGAVTCATMLATALTLEGKYTLAFPRFTGQRRGGPVTAFVRVRDHAAQVPRCEVYEPTCLVIMHPRLLDPTHAEDVAEVLAGFQEDGLMLVNTSRDPDEFRAPVRATVATVNGDAIAERLRLGTPTARPVNTAILGALVRITSIVAFESLEAAIRREVPEKIDLNLAAAREAYESVRVLEGVSHA